MSKHNKQFRMGRYTGHWYIDGIRTNVYGNDATHLYIDDETENKIKAWHDGPLYSIYEREVDVEDDDGNIIDTVYKYALEWDGQFVEISDSDIWGTQEELLAYMVEVAEEWAANETVEDEDGNEIRYAAAVELMDDDLREEIHADLAPCSNQEFFNEYCRRHAEKYGEEFKVI